MSDTFRAFKHEHIAAGQPCSVPVELAITPDHEEWAQHVNDRTGVHLVDSVNIAAVIGTFRLLAMKHGLQLIGQTRDGAIIEPAALPQMTATMFEDTPTRTIRFLPRNWSYLEWMRGQGYSYEATIFSGMHTLGSLATSNASTIAVRHGELQEVASALPWLEKVN